MIISAINTFQKGYLHALRQLLWITRFLDPKTGTHIFFSITDAFELAKQEVPNKYMVNKLNFVPTGIVTF